LLIYRKAHIFAGVQYDTHRPDMQRDTDISWFTD